MPRNIRRRSGLCNTCGKRGPEIEDTSFCFTTATRPSRLDAEVASWGIEVVKSPAHAPTANAFCERLIGSIRRECLDYLIPLSESHLRRTLREWVNHYQLRSILPHLAMCLKTVDHTDFLQVIQIGGRPCECVL